MLSFIQPFLHRSPASIESAQKVPTDNQNPSSLQTFENLLSQGFTFPIEKSLKSSATKVVFNDSDPVIKDICLKSWIACENALYSTSNLTNCTGYLLEGLYFNRRFARDVYLGIALIQHESEQFLKCGPLIKEPKLASINVDQPYVLVMKRLDDSSRLDHQLRPAQLGNQKGIEFLASSIANMHRRLKAAPKGFGTVDDLRKKLQVNQSLYQKSLEQLSLKNQELKDYEEVSLLMEKFLEESKELFERRYARNHIMRCHGDLKAVNLWVANNANLLSQSRSRDLRLLTLDCIDFRPDFCHIDTLSDVAMLAVDLEMRLTFTRGWQIGRQLAAYFLSTYLKEAKEVGDVRPLLEYYMTEKAMVGALMSIHFDGLPTLGEKYLKVALAHAKRLKKHLPSNIKSKVVGKELDFQPLDMVEQVDSSVPVLNQVLVSGISA